MDRRTFITFVIGGLASAACQKATPTPPPTRAVVEVEKPPGTLTIPRRATPAPTSGPAIRSTPAAVVPTAPPRTFSTLTLPPERIVVPSISLDAKVVQLGTKFDRAGATVWETAAFAVGHHRGSANPGEPGNIVLSGHISSPSEGAVFNKLPNLKVGDGLILMTSQQPHMYVVSETQVVKPTAIEFMNPTANSVATLITCVPDGVYSHRLIVRCDAV